MTPKTEVVRRGEHRSTRKCAPGETLDLDELITARGWRPRGHLADKSLLPSWRLGELLHAQQRRERAQQRDVDAVREEWSFGELDMRGSQP